MIDSNSQFFAILTAVGEAKQANATALGTPWTFKEMAVGDANGSDPIPNRTQTKLINEWRRAPVNQVRTDPANPNIIITEQVIPPDVGGRWIREIGLFDADGDLVAVANCAPSFKPLLAQGTGKTQVIRMNFIVANTAQIVLKIDPAVVLATRQYVDDSLVAALPSDKVSGTYRQVTLDKRGIVVSGDNPTTLAAYGIVNAYTKLETNSAIQASVEGKANKATTLDGYGIKDAATRTYVDDLSRQLLPKAGGVVSGPIYLNNGTDDSPELSWKTPSCNAYLDLVGGVLRIFAERSGEVVFPLQLDTATKVPYFFGNLAWHAGNFNPANKADASAVVQATEAARGTVILAGFADVNAGDGFKAMTANMFMNFSLGFRQVWRDMLGSRAAGVGYFNSTSKPIMVSVISSTADRGLYIYVDGVVVSKQGQEGGTGSDLNCVQAIIPPGSTYAVGLLGGATISHWAELRA